MLGTQSLGFLSPYGFCGKERLAKANIVVQLCEPMHSFFEGPRSRLVDFLLFGKVDFLQSIFVATTFFFVVIIFQAFLLDSVPDRSLVRIIVDWSHRHLLLDFPNLEFREGIRFMLAKLLERIKREQKEVNLALM